MRVSAWPSTFAIIRREVPSFAATLELVRELHALGRTSVVVLHDIGQAARCADRLVVMKQGRVATEGKAVDVISPDLVRDVYGLDCVVYPDPVSGTPVVAPK